MDDTQRPAIDDDAPANGGTAVAPGTVGGDIRSLRKSRGLTLQALSAEIGRSVGWLSQVERDQTAATIDDLRQLARLFDIPIGFFFRNEAASERERGLVVRSGARATLGSDEGGLTEELLSPDIAGAFEMVRSVFAPGAASSDVDARPAEDGGYVVSGRLELWIDDEKFEIGPGDSFQFIERPYRWRNPGDEPTEVIWVIAPPIY